MENDLMSYLAAVVVLCCAMYRALHRATARYPARGTFAAERRANAVFEDRC